jgi:hypothetical protein
MNWEESNAYRDPAEKPDLDLGGRTILKWIFKETEFNGF